MRLYGSCTPGAIAWSVLGGVMGLGRFATIFTIMLAVQPPAVARAFLGPGLLIHTTFAVLSGLVSSPLMRAIATAPKEAAATADVTPRCDEHPGSGHDKRGV